MCVGRGSVGPSGTFCDLTENSVYHPIRHSCQEDHLEFVHICVNDEKAQVAILLQILISKMKLESIFLVGFIQVFLVSQVIK